MSYKYGRRSKERLETLDCRLRDVLMEAIKDMDITILQGHRGKAEQDKAFAEGRSKLKFPQSKHNRSPSMAVDCAPYPID